MPPSSSMILGLRVPAQPWSRVQTRGWCGRADRFQAVIARRERFDGADVAHVIYRTQERLTGSGSWRYGGTLGDSSWALVLFRYAYPAQTHYVRESVVRSCLSFQDAVFSSNTAASFRGSLVDEKQFAIDVNEWGLET